MERLIFFTFLLILSSSCTYKISFSFFFDKIHGNYWFFFFFVNFIFLLLCALFSVEGWDDLNVIITDGGILLAHPATSGGLFILMTQFGSNVIYIGEGSDSGNGIRVQISFFFRKVPRVLNKFHFFLRLEIKIHISIPFSPYVQFTLVRRMIEGRKTHWII